MLVLAMCVAAQQSGTPGMGNEQLSPETLQFPYVAEVTGDDVYIRSGPGTNYYRCTKLYKGDRVTVVSSKFSWSQISPPPGSFSWISKRYVKTDPNNPKRGFVTGDNVRVYAGSNELKPIHSTTPQQQLDTGDKVILLGEEQDDYYKISPPPGAYLWISTQYTKPIGPVGQTRVVVPSKTPQVSDANEKSPVVVPSTISTESEKLNEFYALQRQVKEMRSRPILRQNYFDIKKGLYEIANNEEAGKAARYAEYTLEEIKRYELALEVEKELKIQQLQLQDVQQRIQTAKDKRLSTVEGMGKYAVIGTLQKSEVYSFEPGIKYWRVLDDTGAILCYAGPAPGVQTNNIDTFIGKKVGLIGTIKPYPQTSGALVEFTNMEQIK